MYKKITGRKKQRIAEAEGSPAEIAKRFKVHPNTVYRIKQAAARYGRLAPARATSKNRVATSTPYMRQVVRSELVELRQKFTVSIAEIDKAIELLDSLPK